MANSSQVLGYAVEDFDISREQLAPITIVSTVARTIVFPEEFFGSAVNVLIDNRDGLNNLTYRVNTNVGAVKTVGASEIETVSDAKVVLLQILPGSIDWEVQAQVRLRKAELVKVRENL